MQDCDEVLELISAKLDGALTEEETARLDGHLARCPECRALLTDLEAIQTAMPRDLSEPPAGLKDSIMDQIRAEKVVALPTKRKVRWKSWASLAAALAIVLAGGSTLSQWGISSGSGAAAPGATAPQQSSSQATVVQDTAEPEAAIEKAALSPDDRAGGASQETAVPDTQNVTTYTAPKETAPNSAADVPAEDVPMATPVPNGKSSVGPVFFSDLPPAEEPPLERELVMTQEEALASLTAWLELSEEDAAAFTCLGLDEDGTAYRFQAEDGGPIYSVPLDGSEIQISDAQ